MGTYVRVDKCIENVRRNTENHARIALVKQEVASQIKGKTT